MKEDGGCAKLIPPKMEGLNLPKLNRKFSGAAPEEILDWAFQTFPYRMAMTASFQASGVVLIDMIRSRAYDFPIFFIDTRYHFPETMEFKKRLLKEWKLNVHTIIPPLTRKNQERRYGPRLYNNNPDLCCRINKQAPLENLKKEIRVGTWISAIRKDQGKTRRHIKPVMKDARENLRIHPLINWTWDMVWEYIRDRGIPYHPLYDRGYTSIGCFPPSCTQKGLPGKGERAGRWKDREKTECGLHLDLKSDQE